jgi:hypothetical protein
LQKKATRVGRRQTENGNSWIEVEEKSSKGWKKILRKREWLDTAPGKSSKG